MSTEWTSHHNHVFGQDQPTTSERRTVIVVVITAITMVVEIAAGLLYGSMALLADGLHMASHAVALGIAAFAYRYARTHAADVRFSFGTGKVNALAGYSGAILLGVFALGMSVESLKRFVHPVEIAVNQALAVAVLGLVINGVSVFILGFAGSHADHHAHDDEHDPHDHDHHEHHDHNHHDHNFRAAYFHVLADALTSLLAIGALLAAKYLRQTWLDPAMGLVGAVLVARWSVGLLHESGRVLLDRQAHERELETIRQAIEVDKQTRVVDLHLWWIGPGLRAAIIALEAASPQPVEAYHAALPQDLGLAHVTIEIRQRS